MCGLLYPALHCCQIAKWAYKEGFIFTGAKVPWEGRKGRVLKQFSYQIRAQSTYSWCSHKGSLLASEVENHVEISRAREPARNAAELSRPGDAPLVYVFAESAL